MREIFKTNLDVARDCIKDSKVLIENIEKYRSKIDESMAVPPRLLSNNKPPSESSH